MIKKILLSIFILFLGFLAMLLGTNVGLNWTFATTRSLLPGELRVQKLEGQLLGPIKIQNLTYEDIHTEFHLKKLDFDWNPGDLFLGKFQVKKLYVSGVKYFKSKPRPRKTDNGDGISLPLSLILEDVKLEDISIQLSKTSDAIRISKLNLHSRLKKDDLFIHGEWHDLVLPLSPAVLLVSQNAEINVTGRMDDYAIKITGKFSGQNVPSTDFLVTGHGNKKEINI